MDVLQSSHVSNISPYLTFPRVLVHIICSENLSEYVNLGGGERGGAVCALKSVYTVRSFIQIIKTLFFETTEPILMTLHTHKQDT